MRVLYLHQYFSTPNGSTGTRSYEFALRMIASGIDVTMVCGGYDRSDTGLSGAFEGRQRSGAVDGIDVIELAVPFSNKHSFIRRAWNFVQFSVRLIPIVVTQKYDVVFATSTPLSIAVPALVARWVRNKPMVFEVRDLWPEIPQAMGLVKNRLILGAAKLLEWSAYRSASHCVALSPGIKEGIAAKGVSDASISMIPNSSDNNFAARANASDAHAILKEVGIGRNEKLAVFAGAHGIANGLDILLDAAGELKARGEEDITILLVGNGSEKRRLEDRARQEGLTNLRFMKPLPKQDMFSILKRAEVGLMLLKNVAAFHYGTSPNKFFDCLSCGLPPLVNYPGWMAELVEDRECGYWVSPDDPKELANAIVASVKDPHRSKKKRNARKLAKTEFDRDLLAAKFVEIFKRLDSTASKSMNSPSKPCRDKYSG